MRRARPAELPLLPEIERAAGELFAGVESVPGADVGSVEWFQEAHEAGLLWVAADADEQPVAFALFEELGGALHLEEVDVHPDHAHNGLGARLIDAAAAFARELGYGSITLTTFRDVPWNAPYYERIGFEVVEPSAWTPALREQVAEEAKRGLDPERRVVMRRAIGERR